MGRCSEPPTCPNCGAGLTRVFDTNHLTHLWNETEERCGEQNGDLEMKCLECGFDLYEVFTDGLCKYWIRKVRKEASPDARGEGYLAEKAGAAPTPRF